MSNEYAIGERRQGKTGVWTFVIKIDGGKVLATSEWGTNYEFNDQQWEELPVITTKENETR